MHSQDKQDHMHIYIRYPFTGSNTQGITKSMVFKNFRKLSRW